MIKGFDKFRAVKPVSVSGASLVKMSPLREGEDLPLVMEAASEGVDLSGWARGRREEIEAELLRHGAILFRGFRLGTVAEFEQVVRAVSPDLLDYTERSSPRSEVRRGIYTSTDYPADQSIQFHNEQSYTRAWPMKLWFFCLRAADKGGATPLADSRKVLKSLGPQLRERFVSRKVMYVRNYIAHLGLSWEDAFQTTDRTEVEAHCRKASIDFEWRGGNRLRTRQVFEAIVAHPKTGEPLWFEHAAFFHVSSLEPAVRDALLAEYETDDLPFNTYYGDGSPIESSVLSEIREAYRQAAVRFPWQEGDVLLIDNMLTSHGREPYEGPRKIVVAMTDLYSKDID
ncbi:MAG TPA: TauD/TfdA family dioxygenase [Pyrinomonadaceae bacterium]|jgi:alpha-ketoglutarate-dependent taurine dioxygenase